MHLSALIRRCGSLIQRVWRRCGGSKCARFVDAGHFIDYKASVYFSQRRSDIRAVFYTRTDVNYCWYNGMTDGLCLKLCDCSVIGDDKMYENCKSVDCRN